MGVYGVKYGVMPVCADAWSGLGDAGQADPHQGEDPDQELLPELQAAPGVGPDRAAPECQASQGQ